MNVNQNINKLLFALSTIGQFYKINAFQFYSEKMCKYCTKYQLMRKKTIEIVDYENSEVKRREKYIEIDSYYNKIELMKKLAEEYRKGSEANGR